MELENCPPTRVLKQQADDATSEFLKSFLLNSIESLACGEKLDKTFCCDKQLAGKVKLL